MPDPLKAELARVLKQSDIDVADELEMQQHLKHLVKYLPKIENVRFDHIFAHDFTKRWKRTPRLCFAVEGQHYRPALRSLMRSLRIRTMLRHMTTSQSGHPQWYFTGSCRLGRRRYEVQLNLDYRIPDGCRVSVTGEHREVKTHRTYSYSCSVRR